MTSKKCSKCQEAKPYSEFFKNKSKKYGCESQCKHCCNAFDMERKRAKEGLITKIYGNQRASSRKRNHVMPTYLLAELRSWALTQPIFHELHSAWVRSGYSKALIPSFDRLNDDLPYSLDNIHIMTWQENKAKGHATVKNGINKKQLKAVVQMTNDGMFIAEHRSMSHAGRVTKIAQGNISICCSGETETAGGFRWMRSLGIPIYNNMNGLGLCQVS